MSTDDFAAFLTARYDEAEALAKGLIGATRFVESNPDFYGTGGPAAEAFWNHFTPDRMLTDIALKRAILAEHIHAKADWPRPHDFGCENCHYHEELKGNGWCATVRQLGTEFAEHPAYKQEWRPE